MDLTKSTGRHSFFQQVRTMLRHLRVRNKKAPEQILETNLYFVSPLSLDAPKGEIGEITEEREEHFRIEVYPHGLSGALGALPTVYTEWLIERHFRYGDTSGKAFLDIFNHRLHQLRYLAWQKYHYYASAEFLGGSPLSQSICALSGLTEHSSLSSQEKYAGLFAQPVRSLVNLEMWLQNYFSVDVKITPFTGGWKESDASLRCCLGNSEQSLKTTPMLGTVYWDVQSRFTLTLGPIKQCEMSQFLPAGKYYAELWGKVYAYVGPGLDVDIELLIDDSTARQTVLGEGSLGLNMCLGQINTLSPRRIKLPEYQEQPLCS